MDDGPGLPARLRRGLWFRLMLVRRGMTLGVRIIAPDEAGAVLLVRHGYVEGWHLPGGGVDRHETMEAAARRELLEETGHEAAGGLSLLGMAYNRRTWKGDHVGVYVAHAVRPVRAVVPGLEIREVGFFATDALPPGTTPATRARLAEWCEGRPVAAHWS